MVSRGSALRIAAAFLCLVALGALFFKLPEVSGCKRCVGKEPFLPMLAAGYFAALLSSALLYPAFPKRKVARGGLVFAAVLAAVLTYLQFPCVICLIGHGCNLLIWTLWCLAPEQEEPLAIRRWLATTLFGAVSVIALFASLNLTFMAYRGKSYSPSPVSLRPGDMAPHFDPQGGQLWVNFVSPDCPYSLKQIAMINETAASQTRLIYISPSLSPEFIQNAPNAQWIEDKDGKLRTLYKVAGYPTLFIINAQGTIEKIFPGLSNDFKEDLIALTDVR